MSYSFCAVRALLTFAAIAIVGSAASPSALGDETLHVAPPINAPPSPEPDAYRTDDYRKPVPATLKGATVLSAAQALDMWTRKTAVFIDVYPRPPKPPNLPANTLWREPPHFTIENAKWLPNVGYGAMSPEHDAYFRSGLEKLTERDPSRPLVFFCLRNCWMSWNAAKRAIAYGYSAVHWFPDGSDAWQEIGQLVTEAQPEKLP